MIHLTDGTIQYHLGLTDKLMIAVMQILTHGQ